MNTTPTPNYANQMIEIMRQLQATKPGSWADFRLGYEPGSTNARYRGVQFRLVCKGTAEYFTIAAAKQRIAQAA
jgi:hypothetical protein